MVVTLKYASVSIDEVLATKLRLEANVFNVDARKAKETLKNCKWELKTICGENGFATAYRPNMCTRIYVDKKFGIPMFTPSQMTELKPKATKYISENTNTDLSKWYLKEHMIILSCSGTIGNAAIVTKTLRNKLFSQNLIQITTTKNEFCGYLYAYIKSDIGQQLLKSNLYGAVIQHIDPEHLKNIQIPNPNKEIKENIHKLIMDSFNLRDEANLLLDTAEKLLITELHLPSIEELKPKFYDLDAEVRTFSVRLDTLNNRFEGSYHNPIIASILERFFDNDLTVKPLRQLSAEITMPGIFKRIYVSAEEGVPFLGTNDILELSPRVEKFLSKSGHKKLIETQLAVKENTILITDRGTIGNIVLVPEYYEKESWTVSQNSIRVVPISNDIAGYLYVFLSSDYGKVLSKRETYGAVIDMIDPSNAGQIPIPILKDKAIMKEINDLALTANKKRAKAYYKEQEAIQMMNDEVIYATD